MDHQSEIIPSMLKPDLITNGSDCVLEFETQLLKIVTKKGKVQNGNNSTLPFDLAFYYVQRTSHNLKKRKVNTPAFPTLNCPFVIHYKAKIVP